MNENSDFGMRLRSFRSQSTDPLSNKSLSQQRLGALLGEELGFGFSGAAVSDWELGKSKIHADDRLILVGLIKIFYALGGIKNQLGANKFLEAGNYRALDLNEAKRIFADESGQKTGPASADFIQSSASQIYGVFGNLETISALLDGAMEGPSPAWPRIFAALIRNLLDRFTADSISHGVIFICIWLLAEVLLAPSLHLQLQNQKGTLRAMALYGTGSLVIPALISLLAATKSIRFWQDQKLSTSVWLRLYTLQGSYIGFHIGYYAVFLISLILFHLEFQQYLWFEMAIILTPVIMGYIGARVVPYNLWRAFGRLAWRDGAIFFIFVFLGPLWGVFMAKFSALITSASGIFLFLASVALLANMTAIRQGNGPQSQGK